jgi:multicomponent Na+:H+ antiporter subunit D
MSSPILPALIFFLGAALVGLLRGRTQVTVALLVPVAGAANMLFNVEHGLYWQMGLFDYSLTMMRVDKLSLLFGYLFHLAAFIGVVYALHVRDTTQQVSALLYAGGALGAVFAGDLITLFVFWEILAVTSVFLIWARRTARAQAAGMRYLLVQVASGVILLAGALAYLHQTGSVTFEQMQLDGLGPWLIFLAFGIKCAFPLLHNWVTDAYPEATPTGTVFLSAFTTKVAVYAFARSFPGTEWLIYIGVAMAAFPIFYAVIENDLRRVLCYSMINQVGFMVVGIGLGTELALNGAVSHAFNDVIFKGLLFMSMGAVLQMTGKINGSELGGLYKTMPITTVLCIVGAASISAFPLFSGFVSKAMVMAAALEEGYDWAWLVLLFASAGVFHHAGIKIPFFAFFAHDSGIRTKEPPLNMLIAMFIGAAICVYNGIYPWHLYSLLPWPVDYAPYTWTHVITQTQLLFYSALAFIFLKLTHLYPPELPSTNIDAEWAYRSLLPRIVKGVLAMFAPLDRAMRGLTLARVERIVERLYRHHGPEGIMARTWPTGSTALWVAILLAIYLLLSYV